MVGRRSTRCLKHSKRIPQNSHPWKYCAEFMKRRIAISAHASPNERTVKSPVNTRDIHSIDIEQINLEREFEALGLFYERKRAQFEDKSILKRVDAEKCGQCYLAFYEEMPLEAKNRKGMIFGSKYDVIFNSTTT